MGWYTTRMTWKQRLCDILFQGSVPTGNYFKINITFPEIVIVENIIPRNVIFNLGTTEVLLVNINQLFETLEKKK